LGTPATTAGRKNAFPTPATTDSATIAVALPANGSAQKTTSRPTSEAIYQRLAGEPIDERAEEQAEEDRWEQVRYQQRSDPPARVRAVVHVDLKCDERDPVAEAGREVREEEQPELGVAEQR